MITWYWLIVTFVAGLLMGMFLTALLRGSDNDNYNGELFIRNHTIEFSEDYVTSRDEHGNIVRIDSAGVAQYDPETGNWRYLN